MAYVGLSCRCVVALVFAVSAISKVRGASAFRAFAGWIGELPVPLVARRPAMVAAVLAGAETTGAVLALPPPTVIAGMTIAVAALVILTVGTFVVVRSPVSASCQCFGPSFTPIGLQHVVRNGLLCAVAIVGATNTGYGGINLAGGLLSAGVAISVSLLVVFLDDVVGLSADGDAAPRGGLSSGPEGFRQ